MKTKISIVHRGRSESIAWYSGSTAYEIESSIRKTFDLPYDSKIVLREAGGDVIVISEHIPDGKTLFMALDDVSSPSKLTSPYRSPARTSTLRTPYRSPQRHTSPPRSTLSASKPLSASRYRSPPRSAPRSASRSYVSPFRESTLSSSSSPVRDETMAKRCLRDVEKFQKFISRVEELRRDKKDDFFEMSIDGEFEWRRSISNSDFMSAISSDLYFQAGSCGLLSSPRRGDTERVLNAALSAYMDYVRELGRQGNFDPIVHVEAGYAREALDAAYDLAVTTTREIVREKLELADRYAQEGL